MYCRPYSVGCVEFERMSGAEKNGIYRRRETTGWLVFEGSVLRMLILKRLASTQAGCMCSEIEGVVVMDGEGRA
jgi:hypothetical protein